MEHGPFFYLMSWAGALIVSTVTLWIVIHWSFFQKPFERREAGREQLIPKFYRLGGAFLGGIFLIFLLGDSRLEWNPSFIALGIGSFAIILFSVADDLGHVRWPWHLSFQVLLGLLVYSSGMHLDFGAYLNRSGVHFPLSLGFFGVLAWVMLIMNAINWADGTDGLMPGIAALSFGTLFLLALRPEVNQPTVAILAVVLFGLSLSLTFFNWYPARILAGTGGAYFFGFSLAVLALYAGMKVATLLLVLALPVFDALFVLIRRILSGHSPFLPDHEHFHHFLLAQGWRPVSVACAYLMVTGFMGLLALFLEGGSKAWVFMVAGSLLAILPLLLPVRLRVQRKEKLL